MNSDLPVGQELANQLAKCSKELNRRVGLLVNRQGKIEWVIIGSATQLYLPDIGRLRVNPGRLRGIRLIRSHLSGTELLQPDDFSDLCKLRLDMIISVEVKENSRVGRLEIAHLLPENPKNQIWNSTVYSDTGAQPDDCNEFLETLESELSKTADTLRKVGTEPAILVGVDTARGPRMDPRIAEMKLLCKSAGIQVVESVVQKRPKEDPRFALGKGKLEEIILKSLQLGVDILIFAQDLTPGQMRSITGATELKIIDRTQLILDIFAQNANTRDGKIQVELAQLKYTLPRLIRQNTGMSRLMGGIGGRGPGEQKLEIDRRRIRDKIRQCERQLIQLKKQRHTQRKRRQREDLPIISIVGYTNAGKSTLLNALTHSKVLVEDKLFATLDPTTRRLRFPHEREVILADTVGFIQELPKDLVNAFRATLEELHDADLLIHLIDCSNPDFEAHKRAVETILADLEIVQKQTLLVFNKIDLIDKEEVLSLCETWEAIPLSALNPKTLPPVLERAAEILWKKGKSASPSDLS